MSTALSTAERGALALTETKLPLVMKSGLVHWISPELHEKIQTQLSSQGGHTFIRLKELDLTINSAEIEGVYTLAQYEDVVRIKEGQWQCAYRKWHLKKGECECKRDAEREHRQRMQQAEREEQMRPPTPAEREEIGKIIARMRGEGPRPSGTQRAPRGLRRSALIEYQRKFGTPYQVPEGTPIIEDAGAEAKPL